MTLTPTRLTFLSLAAAACLTGCSAGKSATVTIDNQSAAPMQVEVTMPARGIFGRKPCHEGFVTRLEPGESWESTPDTRRWSMDSNPRQAFRVVAVEHTEQPWVIYEPVWFDTSRSAAHFVLRGRPGAITVQGAKAADATSVGEQMLTPRPRN